MHASLTNDHSICHLQHHSNTQWLACSSDKGTVHIFSLRHGAGKLRKLDGNGDDGDKQKQAQADQISPDEVSVR
jgi:hypothetical protein